MLHPVTTLQINWKMCKNLPIGGTAIAGIKSKQNENTMLLEIFVIVLKSKSIVLLD